MLTIIAVRHGEVANPNHVVYGDLPGFDLSPVGVLQAHAVGRHLQTVAVDIVLTSPLPRAVHTATAIARHHGQEAVIDDRLTETRMYPQWTALRWDTIERIFPEQFTGYLDDADALTDVSESVADVARRVTEAIHDAQSNGHQTIVVVGHQDPTQALRLSLLGRPLSELRELPPGHASATTLVSEDGVAFYERSVWNPEIDGL